MLVGPYLEAAIMSEAVAEATSISPNRTEMFWFEYNEYREWQRSGAILSAVIIGVLISALYGLVYALYERSIPGRGHVQKTVVLAGAMWLALYIVPLAKYPTVLPGDGDPATLEIRTMWYVVLIALSGISAVLLHRVSLMLRGSRKAVPAVLWVAIVALAVIMMPQNPDTITTQQDMLNEFRILSAVSITTYWAVLGIVFGVLWKRFGRSVKVWTRNV